MEYLHIPSLPIQWFIIEYYKLVTFPARRNYFAIGFQVNKGGNATIFDFDLEVGVHHLENTLLNLLYGHGGG